jgi:hypothetical protein
MKSERKKEGKETTIHIDFCSSVHSRRGGYQSFVFRLEQVVSKADQSFASFISCSVKLVLDIDFQFQIARGSRDTSENESFVDLTKKR